jgi:hypothetical protein
MQLSIARQHGRKSLHSLYLASVFGVSSPILFRVHRFPVGPLLTLLVHGLAGVHR